MVKVLLLVFGLYFSVVLPAAAQGLEWGLNIAPGVSYRTAPQQSADPLATSIQIGEEAIYVFDFGIDVRKVIAPRIRFGTAILYSQKGFSNTHLAAVYQDPALSRRYLLDFVQDYLEIPFFVTYDLKQSERMSIYALGGVVNSLLLRSNNLISATSGEISEETMRRLKKPYLRNQALHNVGAMAGMGVRTDADAKTMLAVELVGKQMFSPLLDQVSSSQRRLSSFNLNFRIIRKMH